MLFGLPIASANLECRKHYKCVNTTTFNICGDFGDGNLRVIQGAIFSCPPGLVCDENNLNECHFPVFTTPSLQMTIADTSTSIARTTILPTSTTMTSEYLDQSIVSTTILPNLRIDENVKGGGTEDVLAADYITVSDQTKNNIPTKEKYVEMNVYPVINISTSTTKSNVIIDDKSIVKKTEPTENYQHLGQMKSTETTSENIHATEGVLSSSTSKLITKYAPTLNVKIDNLTDIMEILPKERSSNISVNISANRIKEKSPAPLNFNVSFNQHTMKSMEPPIKPVFNGLNKTINNISEKNSTNVSWGTIIKPMSNIESLNKSSSIQYTEMNTKLVETTNISRLSTYTQNNNPTTVKYNSSKDAVNFGAMFVTTVGHMEDAVVTPNIILQDMSTKKTFRPTVDSVNTKSDLHENYTITTEMMKDVANNTTSKYTLQISTESVNHLPHKDIANLNHTEEITDFSTNNYFPTIHKTSNDTNNSKIKENTYNDMGNNATLTTDSLLPQFSLTRDNNTIASNITDIVHNVTVTPSTKTIYIDNIRNTKKSWNTSAVTDITRNATVEQITSRYTNISEHDRENILQKVNSSTMIITKVLNQNDTKVTIATNVTDTTISIIKNNNTQDNNILRTVATLSDYTYGPNDEIIKKIDKKITKTSDVDNSSSHNTETRSTTVFIKENVYNINSTRKENLLNNITHNSNKKRTIEAAGVGNISNYENDFKKPIRQANLTTRIKSLNDNFETTITPYTTDNYLNVLTESTTTNIALSTKSTNKITTENTIIASTTGLPTEIEDQISATVQYVTDTVDLPSTPNDNPASTDERVKTTLTVILGTDSEVYTADNSTKYSKTTMNLNIINPTISDNSKYLQKNDTLYLESDQSKINYTIVVENQVEGHQKNSELKNNNTVNTDIPHNISVNINITTGLTRNNTTNLPIVNIQNNKSSTLSTKLSGQVNKVRLDFPADTYYDKDQTSADLYTEDLKTTKSLNIVHIPIKSVTEPVTSISTPVNTNENFVISTNKDGNIHNSTSLNVKNMYGHDTTETNTTIASTPPEELQATFHNKFSTPKMISNTTEIVNKVTVFKHNNSLVNITNFPTTMASTIADLTSNLHNTFTDSGKLNKVLAQTNISFTTAIETSTEVSNFGEQLGAQISTDSSKANAKETTEFTKLEIFVENTATLMNTTENTSLYGHLNETKDENHNYNSANLTHTTNIVVIGDNTDKQRSMSGLTTKAAISTANSSNDSIQTSTEYTQINHTLLDEATEQSNQIVGMSTMVSYHLGITNATLLNNLAITQQIDVSTESMTTLSNSAEKLLTSTVKYEAGHAPRPSTSLYENQFRSIATNNEENLNSNNITESVPQIMVTADVYASSTEPPAIFHHQLSTTNLLNTVVESSSASIVTETTTNPTPISSILNTLTKEPKKITDFTTKSSHEVKNSNNYITNDTNKISSGTVATTETIEISMERPITVNVQTAPNPMLITTEVTAIDLALIASNNSSIAHIMESTVETTSGNIVNTPQMNDLPVDNVTVNDVYNNTSVIKRGKITSTKTVRKIASTDTAALSPDTIYNTTQAVANLTYITASNDTNNVLTEVSTEFITNIDRTMSSTEFPVERRQYKITYSPIFSYEIKHISNGKNKDSQIAPYDNIYASSTEPQILIDQNLSSTTPIFTTNNDMLPTSHGNESIMTVDKQSSRTAVLIETAPSNISLKAVPKKDITTKNFSESIFRENMPIMLNETAFLTESIPNEMEKGIASKNVKHNVESIGYFKISENTGQISAKNKETSTKLNVHDTLTNLTTSLSTKSVKTSNETALRRPNSEDKEAATFNDHIYSNINNNLNVTDKETNRRTAESTIQLNNNSTEKVGNATSVNNSPTFSTVKVSETILISMTDNPLGNNPQFTSTRSEDNADKVTSVNMKSPNVHTIVTTSNFETSTALTTSKEIKISNLTRYSSPVSDVTQSIHKPPAINKTQNNYKTMVTRNLDSSTITHTKEFFTHDIIKKETNINSPMTDQKTQNAEIKIVETNKSNDILSETFSTTTVPTHVVRSTNNKYIDLHPNVVTSRGAEYPTLNNKMYVTQVSFDAEKKKVEHKQTYTIVPNKVATTDSSYKIDSQAVLPGRNIVVGIHSKTQNTGQKSDNSQAAISSNLTNLSATGVVGSSIVRFNLSNSSVSSGTPEHPAIDPNVYVEYVTKVNNMKSIRENMQIGRKETDSFVKNSEATENSAAIVDALIVKSHEMENVGKIVINTNMSVAERRKMDSENEKDRKRSSIKSTFSTVEEELTAAINNKTTRAKQIKSDVFDNITPSIDLMTPTEKNIVNTKTNRAMFESTTVRSHYPTTETTFSCLHRSQGLYGENNDCTTFYICTDNVFDKPEAKKCPNGTVFSEINKQCTKNLSHCIRGNEFQCSAEGRFNDILKDNYYYICVKNDLNHFVKFKLICQDNFHLDKSIIKCVRDEVAAKLPVSANIKIETSSRNPISTSIEDFKCKKEGKFSDPNDCRKYYVCSERNDRLRKRKRKCESDEVFDKDKQRCVNAESYECDTLKNNVKTRTAEEITQKESPVTTSDFDCRRRDRGKYAHDDDCGTYYVCIGKNNPLLRQCGENEVFNEITKQCTNDLSYCIRRNEFLCKKEGRFLDVLRTNYYYICVKDKAHNLVRFKLQCQKGFHLDKTSIKCVRDEEISGATKTEEIQVSLETHLTDKDNFKCEKEGKFSDPNNCRTYYECLEKNDKLLKKKKKCKSNEVFDRDKKKCVSVESNECDTDSS